LKFKLYNIIYYKYIKLILIILFFISFSQNSYAGQNNSCHKISFKKNDNFSIDEFKVEIDKNKKWTKNNIKILIDNSRIIPQKYKKRFNGYVIIKLKNKSICKFRSKIRQSGDFKDHIIYLDNELRQSLDIHIKDGNIQGITKFKLFIDGTRGISKDEILLTEILRKLKFISPRTFYLDATVNGVKSKMLLQEKTAKEMLEYNRRVESAMFESNEKFLMKSLGKFSNNNLSNNDIGILEDLEKSMKIILPRQINFNWANKSFFHSEISLKSLSLLNKIYIQYQASFNNEFNNFRYYFYDFNNKDLGQNIKENIIDLEMYNLLLMSTNAWHALAANNRKFYWNNTKSYFEPIYYDGNVNIFLNKNLDLRLPVSKNIYQSIEKLDSLLDEINKKDLKNALSNRGLEYKTYMIEEKIKIIKQNLNEIKNKVILYDKEIIRRNRDIKFKQTMFDDYIKRKIKINPNSKFVFLNKDKFYKHNSFLSCEELTKCNEKKFDLNEINKILSGNSADFEDENIYLGLNPNLNIETNYKLYQFKEINLYYSDGIDFQIDHKLKEINIYQKKPEARVFFLKSKIEDYNIRFNGYQKFKQPKFLPFDLKGLTGCLSIIESYLHNVNLLAQNSNCEDTLNIINSKGDINKIEIYNSYLDGLDMDFSELQINNVIISNAGNDCLDVSFGNYNIKDIKIDNCGDKGISIGEKSTFKSVDTKINQTVIGVASKDNSIAKFKNIYLDQLDTCLEAYNKKQEFDGGFIKIEFFQCHNYKKEFTKDYKSEIEIN
jgi:hypothetical protein